MPKFKDWNLLDCTGCRLDVAEIALNSGAAQPCRHCSRTVSVYTFPALVRDVKGNTFGDSRVISSESSCFYHATKTASVICDKCGRFLCGLCDVGTHGGHMCTACLENAAADGDNRVATQRYVHYDSLALVFAVAGILVIPFSFITACISFYFIVRYWKKPLSILPRKRWRYVVAGIISLVTLGFWAVGFTSVVGGFLV